jgi:hypothetical protein
VYDLLVQGAKDGNMYGQSKPEACVYGMKTRRAEQWDGTDVEPGHPRNRAHSKRHGHTVALKEGEDLDELYFRQYSEGDRFA